MKSIILLLNFTLISLVVFKPAVAQDWNKESGYNVIMNYWNWFPDYLIGKTIYPITTDASIEYGYRLKKTLQDMTTIIKKGGIILLVMNWLLKGNLKSLLL